MNFAMFLTNSDQETIQTIWFDLFKVFIKFHLKVILSSISNAFKKLNQRQHDLTHIVLKIMKLC